MGYGKTFLPAQWFGIGQFHGFKAACGHEKARHVGRRAGRCEMECGGTKVTLY